MEDAFLYDNPDKVLMDGGMVLMSVWELVLLGGSERVGAVLKLVFALLAMLNAVRLKAPVVLKRAVASRILAGQRSLQAPAIDCCLTTHQVAEESDYALGKTLFCCMAAVSGASAMITAKPLNRESVDEQDQRGHVLEQVEIDMAEKASEWVVGICQSSLTSEESTGRGCL